jgi:hypothetical protein
MAADWPPLAFTLVCQNTCPRNLSGDITHLINVLRMFVCDMCANQTKIAQVGSLLALALLTSPSSGFEAGLRLAPAKLNTR